MFSTPEPYLKAEMNFHREQIERYFKGAKPRRRRHNVARRRSRYESPRDTQVIAGGTVVSV
jgi:hypothetical protein